MLNYFVPVLKVETNDPLMSAKVLYFFDDNDKPLWEVSLQFNTKPTSDFHITFKDFQIKVPAPIQNNDNYYLLMQEIDDRVLFVFYGQVEGSYFVRVALDSRYIFDVLTKGEEVITYENF